MDKTSLGDRMKGYEHVNRDFLMRRTPVIIRVDGKAFHTWTKHGLPVEENSTDPFNTTMHNAMVATACMIMRTAQNAKVAYTQSDEISILLNDWGTLQTDQWFAGNIQKIASVAASAATAAFNHTFNASNFYDLAMFDARVFNVPKEEVNNYFIWRQQDATRNSIQMLARHYFSHKELHRKNVSQLQDMLMLEHGVNWNDLDTWKKRGSCVVWNPDKFDSSEQFYRDENIPIFTKDREYIEKFLGEKDDR